MIISHRKVLKKKSNQNERDYKILFNGEEWQDLLVEIQDSYEDFDLINSGRWRRIVLNIQQSYREIDSKLKNLLGNTHFNRTDKIEELEDRLNELSDDFYTIICELKSRIPVIDEEFCCLDMGEVKEIYDYSFVKLRRLETNFIEYQEMLKIMDFYSESLNNYSTLPLLPSGDEQELQSLEGLVIIEDTTSIETIFIEYQIYNT